MIPESRERTFMQKRVRTDHFWLSLLYTVFPPKKCTKVPPHFSCLWSLECIKFSLALPPSFPVSFGGNTAILSPISCEMALDTWVYVLLRVHWKNGKHGVVVISPHISLMFDEFISMKAGCRNQFWQVSTPRYRLFHRQKLHMIWPCALETTLTCIAAN